MIDIDRKKRLVEELLEHLDRSQGSDLEKMVKASKEPKDMALESVEVVGKKDPDADIEAVEDPGSADMAKMDGMSPDHKEPDGDEELSDEELAELLKKYLVQ